MYTDKHLKLRDFLYPVPTDQWPRLGDPEFIVPAGMLSAGRPCRFKVSAGMPSPALDLLGQAPGEKVWGLSGLGPWSRYGPRWPVVPSLLYLSRPSFWVNGRCHMASVE